MKRLFQLHTAGQSGAKGKAAADAEPRLREDNGNLGCGC